jgi:hypothetical protein
MNNEQRFEQSFVAAAPARLVVRNVRGTVTVLAAEAAPGEQPVIRVLAAKRLDTGDAERTQVVIEQLADGTVSAETRMADRHWFGSEPCIVDYTISAPRACSVRASSVSGDVVVQGFAGEFNVESVSGGVSLADLEGQLKVKTVSGGIAGRGLAGPVEVDTVSGGVSFSESNLGAIEAKTVSGSVVAHTPLSQGPYRFRSMSGDATLAVPADTRCVAELNSLSGRLQTSLPVARQHHSGRHWSAALGGDAESPRVTLDSMSGNLRLYTPNGGEDMGAVREVRWTERSADVPPPAPPAPPPDPAAARADILERVNRGELTVEQAIQALGQ